MITEQKLLILFSILGHITHLLGFSVSRSALSKYRRYIRDDFDSSSDEVQTRIVGGNVIGQGAITYQLHYSYKGWTQCGATLVEVYGIHLAITATHCVWLGYPDHQSVFKPEYIQVTAGDRKLSDKNHREQFRNVTKIVPHPEFDPKFNRHDITLMFLSSDFSSSPWVEAVPLPGHDWELGKEIFISGWGSNVFGADLLDDLRWVILPVVDQWTCDGYNRIPWYEVYPDEQFCAGELGSGRQFGSCTGDSGGPAVTFNETTKENYLAGIISFGLSLVCGNPYFPTVYTKITHYVDWIRIEVSKYREENGLRR